MTIVLGLNAYHGDSSACIVVNGELVAAAEEERFRRIKHWAGFPSQAIAYCLSEAGVSLDAVSDVAVNSDRRAFLGRKVGFALRNRPDPRLVLDRVRNAQRRASIAEELAQTLPGQRFSGRIHAVEHHRAHLASAFYASEFDECVAVSVDGFGDFSSAAWGLGQGHELSLDGRVFFPHSLGIFYQALTQFLGFPHYGDEYKVMGLAPYGEPKYVPELNEVVSLLSDGTFALSLRYFRHHNEKIPYTWTGGSPEVGTLYADGLIDLLGPSRSASDPLEQRHRDLARSVQVIYEDAFFHLLQALYARYGCSNLGLAGGCANNSVANGKVCLRTPFRRVYVQSAPGDAGGAIGAALIVAKDVGAIVRRGQMPHAQWGPRQTQQQIVALLDARRADLVAANCTVERTSDEGALCAAVAEHIARGEVVGWVHGRMEWGPRALGNRSILGDPRRADMKDILNLKIKRRESFRPFAPSVLREAVDEWFEQDHDVPFMTQVFQIREAKRALIPAVTHVDGSGRLQTVAAQHSPRYHRLISAFRDATGVPMVLNTSFNENEPVVCRPEEALDCFLRTKMDVLVLEDHVIRRVDNVVPRGEPPPGPAVSVAAPAPPRTNGARSSKLPITVVIPTRNEEKNLPSCLSRLREFSEVWIVDSRSTDRTREIATRHGARVIDYGWAGGFPKKRNWTLLNQQFRTEWVLFLDADEQVTEPFVGAARRALNRRDVVGFWLNYETHFMGRTLSYGVPQRKLALFRVGAGLYEPVHDTGWSGLDMEVHEHPVLAGKVGEIEPKIRHLDFRGMAQFLTRHEAYSSWEAKRFEELSTAGPDIWAQLTQRQRFKYKHVEKWWFAPTYFLTTYVLKRGFLDGPEGLRYALLKTAYFRDVKLKIDGQSSQS